MNELASIIEILPEGLISYVRNQLPSNTSRSSGRSKYLQLFDLIRRYGQQNDKFYSAKLYKDGIHSEYRVLKHRLKNKILQVLLQEEATTRVSSFDRIDLEMMESIRQLYAIRILLRLRGNTQLIFNLLTEVENKTKKNEHYGLLLECLHLKKYNLAYIKSVDEFALINSEIEKIHTYYKLVNKANDSYHHFILLKQIRHTNSSEKENSKQLRNSINELRKDIEYTKSPLALYFVLMLEMEYHEVNRNFEAGRETSEAICNHVVSHPSVMKSQRLGSAFINAAFFNAKLKNYSTASLQAEKALEHTLAHATNTVIYTIVLIKLNIYQDNLMKAEQLLTRAKQIAYNIKSDALLAQLEFLKLIILIKENKLRHASKIALINTHLDQDKYGYGIYQRLFAVYTLGLLGKTEGADSILTMLMRKRSEYCGKNQNVRLFYLIELLAKWSKHGYNINLFSDKEFIELRHKLNSSIPQLAWSPLDHEVISLSELFFRTVSKRKPQDLTIV
ncbi:MAG: hypothetical protein IT233_04480 [Bacteroidia bacterium]|nr:hypothetical protein [Bacteroidia bacterium]